MKDGDEDDAWGWVEAEPGNEVEAQAEVGGEMAPGGSDEIRVGRRRRLWHGLPPGRPGIR